MGSVSKPIPVQTNRIRTSEGEVKDPMLREVHLAAAQRMADDLVRFCVWAGIEEIKVKVGENDKNTAVLGPFIRE
jgi:hypothetical protein